MKIVIGTYDNTILAYHPDSASISEDDYIQHVEIPAEKDGEDPQIVKYKCLIRNVPISEKQITYDARGRVRLPDKFDITTIIKQADASAEAEAALLKSNVPVSTLLNLIVKSNDFNAFKKAAAALLAESTTK